LFYLISKLGILIIFKKEYNCVNIQIGGVL